MKLVTKQEREFLDNSPLVQTPGATLGTGASASIAATVAALAVSTNITAVPASFADATAAHDYLALAIPIIETRLDNLETKVNAILTSIKAAGQML